MSNFLNASINEYAFARFVEDYNNLMLDKDKPQKLITATQGRDLHRAVLQNLSTKRNGQNEVLTMDNASRVAFVDALNVAIVPFIGSKLGNVDKLKTMYTGYTNEFAAMTNWDLSQKGLNDRRAGKADMRGYIPVSPFDNRYSMRSNVLSHGTEILYARTSDMVAFKQQNLSEGSYYVPTYKNTPSHEDTMMLFQKQEINKDGKDTVRFRNVGSAYTKDDASGLSRLRPYLSDNDYKSISGWMTAVPDSDKMTPQAMERSVCILKMLQEQGIPYNVVKDRNVGQVKANISNTKIDIRLTDTKKNEQYIGRVYKAGHTIYMGSSKSKQQPLYMSTNDVQALVQYALGENPDRLNNTSTSKNIGTTIGSPSMYYDRRTKAMSRTTYMSEKNGAMTLHTYAGYSEMQPDTQNRCTLTIHTTNKHSASHLVFNTDDEAETFLKESIDSARNRFVEMVNLDYLIQEAEEHKDDETYVPNFSSDSAISPIQHTYWEVLTGKSDLYRPEEKKDDQVFNALFDALGLNDMDDEDEDEDEADVQISKTSRGDELYSGTPEENVRAHLKDSMDVLFGTFEPDKLDGKRFNPSMVSNFMDSPNGVYRNNDNLVAAMYKLQFTGDEVRGDDFQTGAMKDRLLRFDAESAQKMVDMESPFMHSMYETIKTSLENTACRVNSDDILIDKNGVVHYTAYQFIGKSLTKEGNEQRIEGELGQIFEPDKQGVVETHYNGSKNKLFTPGYDAYIIPETSETAGKDMMERVRLRGLEQIMKQNISQTIRYDLLSGGEDVKSDDGRVIGHSIGTTTNINNTYRGLYATTYQVSIEQQPNESLKDTYIRQTEMTHLPKDVLDARFETAAGLIHFDKDIAENSTVSADFYHKRRLSSNTSVHALTNDNAFDAFELTGRTNMAITQNHSAGYTDPVLTGSGKNQGIVRYLAVGTKVESDGRIIPSEDKNARAPLMYTSPMRYCDYIPADRVQMVGSNYLTASGVAGMDEHEMRSDSSKKVTGVGIAQLTLQGLTFDDGAVISKEFAEANGVVAGDGEVRPLRAGDKICDFAGNKSIVAKVIDRNMSLEEAKEKGVETSVKLFVANPDLDVVQAPYSAVSRFNAAGAKLAMENTMDLVLPDGSVHEGCIGFVPISITKHTADEHTRLYGAEDDEPTVGEKGRKVSAQLCWLFSAKNSENMMNEVFSSNNSAVSNYREVLNVMGLDMDEVGTLRKGYKPHQGEERYVFKLPDDDVIANTPEKDIINLFKDSVDSRGGFLEIPFEMTLPSGEKTQPVPPELSSRPDRTMYQLPVLSAHMRSGQTFEDGISMVHDYTNQYTRVFKNAVTYLKAENDKNAAEAAGNKDVADAQSRLMWQMQNDADIAYSTITDDLRVRKFETKHNSVRDDFMAKRMPHSATAVWTPDTNLALDEIAMSSEMMKNLGVKPDRDDHIMVWRDPILRDYGARYMKVKLDDSLTGVSVNPLVAVAFDGDFDGDSVGMWKPSWEASKKEAMEQFSFENTMLDTTQRRENGDYKLIFNVGMDVVSAEVADAEKRDKIVANGGESYETLGERRMRLEHEANEIYRTPMTAEDRLAANKKVLSELSDWAKDTLCNTCGTEIVSYKNPVEHAESLSKMVDHGAKGSYKKLDSYFKYFGLTYDTDEKGRVLSDTVVDVNKTLATEHDVEDTEAATAIKSHGTGIAGAVSQRIVAVMRNLGIEEKGTGECLPQQNALSSALQLTYLSTQGILQAKHDPIQAQRLYEMISEPIREAWRGHSLEAQKAIVNGEDRTIWVTKRTLNSMTGEMEPIQATKDEWIKTFMDIHTSKDGLDLDGAINIEQVKQVADVLYDKNTGRMMDIEDEETIKRTASPMDILAYRPKNAFATICEMADEHVNLFEGKCNKMFAPKSITKNMEAQHNGDESHAIQSKDTQADYNPVKKSRSAIAVHTVDKEVSDMMDKTSMNEIMSETEFVSDLSDDMSNKSVENSNITKSESMKSSIASMVNYSKATDDVAVTKEVESTVSVKNIPDGFQNITEQYNEQNDEKDDGMSL